MKIEMCDDCFDDFEQTNINQTRCNKCLIANLTSDQCVHAWKIMKSKSKLSDEDKQQFAMISNRYAKLTSKKLTNL
jgi:hypothetical protein